MNRIDLTDVEEMIFLFAAKGNGKVDLDSIEIAN